MAPETGCAFGTTAVYPHVSLESSALARCESPAFPETLALGAAVAVAPSDALAPPGADAPAFLFASRAEPTVRDVAPGSVAGPGGTVLRVFLLGERGAAADGGRVVPACAFGAVAPVARAPRRRRRGGGVRLARARARGGVSVRVGDAFGEFGRVGRDVAVATTRDDVFAETRDAETRGADAGRLDRPTATAAYPDVASPFGGARLVITGASLDRARARRRAFRRHARAFRGDGVFGARLRGGAVAGRARDAAVPASAVETLAGAAGDDVAFAAFVFAFAAPPEAVSVSPAHVVSTFGGW